VVAPRKYSERIQRLRLSVSTPAGVVGTTIVAVAFALNLWNLLSPGHDFVLANVTLGLIITGPVLVWSAQYEYTSRHWLAGALALAAYLIGFWHFWLAVAILAVVAGLVLQSPPERRF